MYNKEYIVKKLNFLYALYLVIINIIARLINNYLNINPMNSNDPDFNPMNMNQYNFMNFTPPNYRPMNYLSCVSHIKEYSNFKTLPWIDINNLNDHNLLKNPNIYGLYPFLLIYYYFLLLYYYLTLFFFNTLYFTLNNFSFTY